MEYFLGSLSYTKQNRLSRCNGRLWEADFLAFRRVEMTMSKRPLSQQPYYWPIEKKVQMIQKRPQSVCQDSYFQLLKRWRLGNSTCHFSMSGMWPADRTECAILLKRVLSPFAFVYCDLWCLLDGWYCQWVCNCPPGFLTGVLTIE